MATTFDGALGVVFGVTVVATDPAPPPATLTALNEMLYKVPFVKPGTTIGDVVNAGFRVTHEPVPTLYS